MKKQLRKIFALLAAGAVLTGSAAAYAAQLPQERDVESYVVTSDREYGLTIRPTGYYVTPTSLHATFKVDKWGAGDVHYRNMMRSYRIEKEISPSHYETIYESETHYGLINEITIDQPLSLVEGDRIRVQVSVTGYAFYGYTPLPSATDTQEYYYNISSSTSSSMQ